VREKVPNGLSPKGLSGPYKVSSGFSPDDLARGARLIARSTKFRGGKFAAKFRGRRQALAHGFLPCFQVFAGPPKGQKLPKVSAKSAGLAPTNPADD